VSEAQSTDDELITNNLLLSVCCISGGMLMEPCTEGQAGLMVKLSLLPVQTLGLEKKQLWILLAEVTTSISYSK